MTTHVKTLPQTEITDIPAELTKILTEKGVTVVAIEKPIEYKNLKKIKSKTGDLYLTPYDMRPLKEQLNIDQLVVVDLSFVGVQRSYSAYVPHGGPQASVQGLTYLIDLTSNTYKMYQPINLLVPVQGEWDEPPAFPGVTTAYYDVLERAKSQILGIFQEK